VTAGRDDSLEPELAPEDADGIRGPQETAAPDPDDAPTDAAPTDAGPTDAGPADADADAEPADADAEPAVSDADGTVLEADLFAAQGAVASLTDDLQRLQAEYVNYKRRVDRDRELVLQNAKFSILSALLPILDDVDRAREHEELNGGFKAIAEALERIVAGEGLVKFGASGDPFDPRVHEALMHSLSPDVSSTTCDKVVQAGYQFGDRVVRPALVTVVDPDPSASAAAQPAEAGTEDESGNPTTD
jgi:molecular chaperone GrpE